MPLINAYVQAAGDGQLINLAPSLPLGIASIQIALARPSALGGADQGAITIGPTGTHASTAAGLIKVTISLPAIPLVIPAFQIPLILELGASTATITDVSCGADLMTSTSVTVSAQSGLVNAYIGVLNNLDDLGAPLPAVNLGIVQIGSSGNPTVSLGASQTFTFNRSDITAGTVKSVNGGATIAAALNTLATNLTLTPNIPVVRTLITTVLSTLAPTLDSVLTSLGLQLGYLDVRATTVRCGIPALVN